MSGLIVENIGKQFPTRGEPLVVLRDISFALATGESLAVVGPSGCGKSTLLHIVGTLDTPTSGSIRLGDVETSRLSGDALADFRNRQIGFVFQDHHLLPQCSVLENVLIPTLAQGGSSGEQIERARWLLKRVGLLQRMEHRPAELSGGERQRAAIARAMLLKPSLLLADEPTGNLDRTTAASIADLLLVLQAAEQTMLLVVTHSEELANKLPRRATIDEGCWRAV
jgi:lipoprotein-releasing system ATP-binding protein